MLSPSTTLTGLPPSLRDELLDAFRAIANNYVERRWEPSELNGGKFCEAVYCVIEGAISGAMPPHATKPSNMVAACRDLEKKPANASLVGDRSLRILIPRTLLAMYEIRNNRNVGHVGGDVNPNFMDATVVYSMASWTLAELVRIFHNISTQEAQALVDSLVERKSPLIWELEDTKMRRVLDPTLSMKDQTLALLHSRPGWTADAELKESVGYSSLSMFRTRILKVLHKARLIEFDAQKNRAQLSPLGINDVESRILKKQKL